MKDLKALHAVFYHPSRVWTQDHSQKGDSINTALLGYIKMLM